MAWSKQAVVCMEQGMLFETKSKAKVIKLFKECGFIKEGDYYFKTTAKGKVMADILAEESDGTKGVAFRQIKTL